MMRRLYSLAILLLSCIALSAEEYQELWIAGSAVPGGVQKLQKVSNDDFKYAGRLNVGELRIMTTKKVGRQTRCLTPVLPDANIANHGLAWQETAGTGGEAWQVRSRARLCSLGASCSSVAVPRRRAGKKARCSS